MIQVKSLQSHLEQSNPLTSVIYNFGSILREIMKQKMMAFHQPTLSSFHTSHTLAFLNVPVPLCYMDFAHAVNSEMFSSLPTHHSLHTSA